MGIQSTAAASELFGDLYSLHRLVVDSPEVEVKRVYFDRIDGDNFERPSMQLKIVSFKTNTGSHVHKSVVSDVMLKYFAATEFEAISAAATIVDLLSGWPEKSIPRYNFAVTPPEPISFTGVNEYGQRVPWTVGIRIDPDSIKADPFKTEDDNWETAVMFTMTAPRHRATNPLFITSITFETLTSVVTGPTELAVTMGMEPSVTVS